HRSKGSRTPSQSESADRQAPNAGAATVRVSAPTTTRHQADRVLKRVMVCFLSAEGSSSVASAKRERDLAGLATRQSLRERRRVEGDQPRIDELGVASRIHLVYAH